MNNPLPQLFAVVDIETTGGRPIDTKITEIGIVISDGKNILQEYSSLVNPNRKIDWYVTKLTGISNDMVSTAPSFQELSTTIRELLDGKTFVAHNVDFDYSIVRREFLELGQPLDTKKLCTVSSSKKVFHGLNSYSLGNLAEHLEIPLENAHRALEDARATAQLLHKILEKGEMDFLSEELSRQNYIFELPENWKVEETIDHRSGVVYFLTEEKKIIHIDHTKSFQRKIYDVIHQSKKKDFFSRMIVELGHTIIFEEIKEPFKAEIKSMNEIQTHRPRFNKPFKTQEKNFILHLNKDEKGLYYLMISRAKNLDISEIVPMIYCTSFRSAEKLKDKFNLSPEISQLAVLKKQIYVDDELMQSLHIKQYNETFLNKLHKEYFCPVRNGYYVFNINKDNEIEGIQIKNHYLYAWGQGRIEQNKIRDFRAEYLFHENQKLTRKFLNILPKTSYKLIADDED